MRGKRAGAVYLYPYSLADQGAPCKIRAPDPSLRVCGFDFETTLDSFDRRPVAAQLPFCIPGYALPTPGSDHPSIVAGAMHRFGCEAPDFEEGLVEIMALRARALGYCLAKELPLHPVCDQCLPEYCVAIGLEQGPVTKPVGGTRRLREGCLVSLSVGGSTCTDRVGLKAPTPGAYDHVKPASHAPDPPGLSWFCKALSGLVPVDALLRLDRREAVEEWLLKSSFSGAERTAILTAWDDYQSELSQPRHRGLGTFVKDERYEDFKPHRLINARCNFYKALFGPVFHEVEKHVFAAPHFVKGRADKVAAITEALTQDLPIIVEGDDCLIKFLNGAVVSDFDAYESLFVQLWLVLEREIFSQLVGHVGFLELYYLVTGVINECIVRGKGGRKPLRIRVRAKRMSGEVTTSIGNSLSNLLAQSWIYSNVVRCGRAPTADDYRRIGLRCKVEYFPDPSEAGFCGLRFDTESRQAVKDPRPVLLKLGWSKSQYVSAGPTKLRMLLELKAQSLAHELPHCPILGVVSRALAPAALTQQHLKLAEHALDAHERAKLRHGSVPPFAPTPKTRELFARLYDISVSKQLSIEAAFLACRDPTPLVELFHGCDRWAGVWDEYVATAEGFYVPTLSADSFFARYPSVLDLLGRSWVEKHRHIRSPAKTRHRITRHARRKLSVEDEKLLATLRGYAGGGHAVGHHARPANAFGAAPRKSRSVAVSE